MFPCVSYLYKGKAWVKPYHRGCRRPRQVPDGQGADQHRAHRQHVGSIDSYLPRRVQAPPQEGRQTRADSFRCRLHMGRDVPRVGHLTKPEE